MKLRNKEKAVRNSLMFFEALKKHVKYFFLVSRIDHTHNILKVGHDHIHNSL